MTIVSVPQLLVPDPGPLVTAGGVAFNSLLLDASAEKAAFILRAPKAGNIARVGFRTGTVTTGDTLKVSLQDVSGTTGDPDGVADQFRTVAVADTDDNIWVRTNLITSDGTDGGSLRAVTRGAIFALVIEFNSFVAGNLNIAATLGVTAPRGPWLGGPSYADHFTAAWAKVTTGVPVVAIEYDDGSFAFMGSTLPALTPANTSFNSGTENGLKFKLPMACRIGGFWFYGGAGNTSSDYTVNLYDSDGTTSLGAVSYDATIVASVGTGAVIGILPSSVSLLANTFYRIGILPAGANTVTLYNITLSSAHGAAILDQMSGGQNFHWTSRAGAGAWSDDTSRRPFMGLFIDGLDSGGGGLSRARVVNAGGM